MSGEENLEQCSLDAFVGGKISLFQPLNGYRANVDSILLAAAVNAKEGESVLELGCGVGAVMLSLMSRINGLNVVGIECQKQYAKLAIRNAAYNGFKAEIIDCDILSIPIAYKNLNYNHVILNPPFFSSGSSMRILESDKDTAKRELNHSLEQWLDLAIKRCSVKGEVVIIHQAARLGQIITIIEKRLGDIKILPISSFSGQHANRVIVKGKKGSLAPLKLLTPLVMHKDSSMETSGTNYTENAEGILRKGDGMNWGEQNW